MGEYKECVVNPEMAIGTKQVNGRGVRIESDTCCAAYLDIRMRERGSYREYVLDALPGCRVTSSVDVVEGFYKDKKNAQYFS